MTKTDICSLHNKKYGSNKDMVRNHHLSALALNQSINPFYSLFGKIVVFDISVFIGDLMFSCR